MILLGFYFEFCDMNEIHIGEKIKNVLDSSDISVSDFARKINKSRGNIYSIFSRETIDTNLLLKISNVLEYDFFMLFSFSSKNLLEKNHLQENEINMLKKLNQLLIEKYEKE
jgi:hypothetical protein